MRSFPFSFLWAGVIGIETQLNRRATNLVAQGHADKISCRPERSAGSALFLAKLSVSLRLCGRSFRQLPAATPIFPLNPAHPPPNASPRSYTRRHFDPLDRKHSALDASPLLYRLGTYVSCPSPRSSRGKPVLRIMAFFSRFQRAFARWPDLSREQQTFHFPAGLNLELTPIRILV